MIDNQAAHTAVRSVLRHHKLTQHGDSVVEADLIAAVMSAVYTTVNPRHPTVVKWRNDGIEACAGIADAYGNTDAARDIRALLTTPQPHTKVELSKDQIDTLVRAYLGDCGPQANSIYAFVRAVSALTYSALVQISDKEDTQCTDVINTSADSADGAVVTTTGAPSIQTTRPTLEQTAMDRTRDLAESGGRWPSDWVEAYSRGVSDTVRAQCLPNIEQNPSTYWDAFVEELRKDVGVDHVASIIGGVTKLKALYLRAAGMVKPDPDPVPDPHLLKFYNVATTSELIAAQARHIERLQAKLSTTPSLVPQQVREG